MCRANRTSSGKPKPGDVGHHVVRARGRLHAESGFAKVSIQQIPPLPVLVGGPPVVLLRQAEGGLAGLLQWCRRRRPSGSRGRERMPRESGAGATTQPTRQPVTA